MNNIKNLENDIQRRKRDVDEERLKNANIIREVEILKSSSRQHEGVVQDFRI